MGNEALEIQVTTTGEWYKLDVSKPLEDDEIE